MDNRAEILLYGKDICEEENSKLHELKELRIDICISLFRSTEGSKKLTELMKAKPNNFSAEEEEKTFQYRSYGKGELASLYLPNITQQSAVERFNEWIDAAPGLKERLLATGMNPRSRRYTPAQVRLIVEVLEEP